MTTQPATFHAADFHARELQQGEVLQLQALFDACPEYSLLVNGRAPLPDEAQAEFDAVPPPSFPYTRRWFLGLFDRTGELAGLVDVVSDFCAPQVWHIGLFFIATPLRGTGIAQRIYDALEAWMRRSGAEWLRLGVVAGNPAGERFWQKQGFEQARLREGVDTGGRINAVRVLVKSFEGAPLDGYLALVPRDRPDSQAP